MHFLVFWFGYKLKVYKGVCTQRRLVCCGFPFNLLAAHKIFLGRIFLLSTNKELAFLVRFSEVNTINEGNRGILNILGVTWENV